MVVQNPILVVDDEVEMRIAMSTTLKKCGFKIDLSHSAADAIKKFKDKTYSLVITDMTMPKKSGVELLKDLKAIRSDVPVILMTAHGTIETAIESMKHGAFDYILKPFDFDTIVFLIERALTSVSDDTPKQVESLIASDISKPTATPVKIKASSGNSSDFKDIITEDSTMKELLDVAQTVAQSKATVLIEAESGTGKELLAQYIHNHSNRNTKPFVAINCAALPESLLESELFGHKKGAFTGAINEHKGKFEQANGGTILLDEISEMALPLQAKLLRVLQEEMIDKIGGTESISLDIRVIATTNRNLKDYVNEGNFREDLYFRLNVIPLYLPPLRKRKGDIKILSQYFVQKHSKINNLAAPEISEATMRVLEQYSWRGNVRELENVMERSLILSRGKTITPSHLLMSGSVENAGNTGNLGNNEKDEGSEVDKQSGNSYLGLTLQKAEERLIKETMKKNNYNLKAAAEVLGISVDELKVKLDNYN